MLNPNDCPGLSTTCRRRSRRTASTSIRRVSTSSPAASSRRCIPVHSFTKMQKAIADKAFETTIDGIPVLKYDAVIAGEVQKPGLGPLHTEFDGKGYAYTSMFISSEIVKWKLGTWEVVDRVPTYYSIGHLMIPGGDSKKPFGKYVVAMNKITKDRYLPDGRRAHAVGAALRHQRRQDEAAARLPDHRRAALRAGDARGDDPRQAGEVLLARRDNANPYVARAETEDGHQRNGKRVDVKMIAIRSHFAPDNIEGMQQGDTVYFHVTNIEQDWDILHGFAVTRRRELRADHAARRDAHAEVDSEARRRLPVLLHRLLLGAAPGDAGLRPCLAAGTRKMAADVEQPQLTRAGRSRTPGEQREHEQMSRAGRYRMLRPAGHDAAAAVLLGGAVCGAAVAHSSARAAVSRRTRDADSAERDHGVKPNDLQSING